jgi:hypothetical protein
MELSMTRHLRRTIPKHVSVNVSPAVGGGTSVSTTGLHRNLIEHADAGVLISLTLLCFVAGSQPVKGSGTLNRGNKLWSLLSAANRAWECELVAETVYFADVSLVEDFPCNEAVVSVRVVPSPSTVYPLVSTATWL